MDYITFNNKLDEFIVKAIDDKTTKADMIKSLLLTVQAITLTDLNY